MFSKDRCFSGQMGPLNGPKIWKTFNIFIISSYILGIIFPQVYVLDYQWNIHKSTFILLSISLTDQFFIKLQNCLYKIFPFPSSFFKLFFSKKKKKLKHEAKVRKVAQTQKLAKKLSSALPNDFGETNFAVCLFIANLKRICAYQALCHEILSFLFSFRWATILTPGSLLIHKNIATILYVHSNIWILHNLFFKFSSVRK